MKAGKGFAGVHRIKRDVDRLWLKRQLTDNDLTLESFAASLAKHTKREEPLDKASISRRIKGQIPFTTIEAEAMARMFRQPIETVLAKIGGASEEPPLVGAITDSGSVDVRASKARSASLQRLVLDTRDGWQGAIVFAAAKPTPASSARRGLYLAATKDGKSCVIQVIGATGSTLMTAALHGEITNNLQVTEIKELCRVTKIEFPG